MKKASRVDISRHVPDKTLSENISITIQLASVQLAHAQNLKGRTRSGYYKIVCFLLASVVEALVHVLLHQATKKGIKLPTQKTWQLYEQHELPQKFALANEHIFICKGKKVEGKLKNNTEFNVVNTWCQELGLFKKKKLYNACEKVRLLRNKIHLQGLDTIDRKYTKQDAEKIASVILQLLALLETS